MKLLNTKLITILLMVIFFTVCATLISGTSDEITFTSNVDPVKVYIEGLYVGKTPLRVEIEKKVGVGRLIRFEKKGYKTQEFNLKNRFDTVAILDISSIIVSAGIDILSGALMEYSPKQYHIEMIADEEKAIDNQNKQIQFASFILINSEAIKKNITIGSGEFLDSLIELATSGNSPYKFSKWISDNTDSILNTESPEKLLSKIRSSGLTP